MAILLRHRGIVRPSCHWLVIHTFFLSFQPRLSYIWRHTCLYRRQFPCYCKTKLAHWHHSLCSHFEEYCFFCLMTQKTAQWHGVFHLCHKALTFCVSHASDVPTSGRRWLAGRRCHVRRSISVDIYTGVPSIIVLIVNWFGVAQENPILSVRCPYDIH